MLGTHLQHAQELGALLPKASPRFPPAQAASFLASASPSNLAESALAIVAVAYLAPPLAKNAADRIRGYAGGLAGAWRVLSRQGLRHIEASVTTLQGQPNGVRTFSTGCAPPPLQVQATLSPAPPLMRWCPRAATS